MGKDKISFVCLAGALLLWGCAKNDTPLSDTGQIDTSTETTFGPDSNTTPDPLDSAEETDSSSFSDTGSSADSEQVGDTSSSLHTDTHPDTDSNTGTEMNADTTAPADTATDTEAYVDTATPGDTTAATDSDVEIDTSTEQDKTVCMSSTGYHSGYYYEFFEYSGESSCMTLTEGGTFSVQWSDSATVYACKGKKTDDANQIIHYRAEFNPTGTDFLAGYGWFTDPEIEYFIVESWGAWRPVQGTLLGTVETDDGVYDVYKSMRTRGKIFGPSEYTQFWSVRQTRRTEGTITVANHFNAWKELGMADSPLYQVMLCVQTFQSSGESWVTQLAFE